MNVLRSRYVAFIAAVLVLAIASAALSMRSGDDKPFVIGKVALEETTRSVDLTEDPGPPEIDAPGLAPDPLKGAKGSGPGSALDFRGAVNVPKDLLFFLVIGSDARPGQDTLRSRADSIHIAALDPLTREGTVLGLPRDSYVDVPGHGRRKINSALPLGGPELMVKTVRALTGFPIEYYAVTAFDGMVKMVDDLKGVDIKVPYRMDDRYSGAKFEPGWHRMNGRQVLAFSRARHGVPGGDFGRSENHGRVIIHTLEKLRASTKDTDGIKKWLKVLYKRAKLDMSMADAIELGVLARQVVPKDLTNVVTEGTPQSINGESVVVLDPSAYELFKDVGADAQADGNTKRGTPKAPPPGTTPTPKPKPTTGPAPTPPLDLPL